jgi:maltoporin
MAMPGGGSLESILLSGSSTAVGNQTGVKEYEAMRGTQLSLLHTQPNVAGGDNLFVVQYGQGLFGGDAPNDQSGLNEYGAWGTQDVPLGDSAAAIKAARDKSYTLRLIEQLVVNPTPHYSAALVMLYQNVNFGGGRAPLSNNASTMITVPEKIETTAGTRQIYHFDKVHDVTLEYGYTKVQNVINLPDGHGGVFTGKPVLQKFTLAPQLTNGPGFWGRPQIRLFGTYAIWNNDAKGSVGAPIYANDTKGFSTGAQVETWW